MGRAELRLAVVVTEIDGSGDTEWIDAMVDVETALEGERDVHVPSGRMQCAAPPASE